MSLNNRSEKHVVCPYNPAHSILESRMQYHLTRCTRSNDDRDDFTHCPFNSTHVIPKSQINSHMSSCLDKRKIDTFTHQHVFEEAAPPSFFPITNPDFANSGENWDDCNFPTYDPKEYLKTAPVLQSLIGGTRSQRRQFREEQRRKFQNLQNGQPNNTSNAATTALRLPRSAPLVLVQENNPVVHNAQPENAVRESAQSINAASAEVGTVPDNSRNISLSTDVNMEEEWTTVKKYSRGRGRGRFN